ncbi:MAG: MaoC family dehydratase N-terminal domain-containing protein [Kofleriaceae bacterium]|nr:MaoC family dehydratase N-terminal domain-containing protein [Kofleriaceae bacterium]
MTVIPSEVRERIGVEKARSYQVTARDIRRFAQAIGDDEPVVGDDGRLVAPALFCQVFMFEDVPAEELPPDGSPKELELPIPATRTVGGASEFEVLGRVREHDVITVHSTLKDVVAKEGKRGTLFLVVVETVFHNQHGEPVARETATYVKR